MAWASAFANNSSNTSVSTRRRACRGFGSYRPTQSCNDFTEDNENAEYLADNNVRSLRGTETRQPMNGYMGLQKFYDLGSDARDSDDARLHVNIEVSMPLEDVDESNEIFHGTEQHNAVVAAGTTLSAISSADVLYRRPNHYELEESEREKANAYNPYWQAQLVPGAADRYTVAPLRAGDVTPMAYGAPLDSQGGSSSDLGYYEIQ